METPNIEAGIYGENHHAIPIQPPRVSFKPQAMLLPHLSLLQIFRQENSDDNTGGHG